MTSLIECCPMKSETEYALNAGARSLEEPSDMPYGDRRCMVEDKWGNTWQIATYPGERDAA